MSLNHYVVGFQGVTAYDWIMPLFVAINPLGGGLFPLGEHSPYSVIYSVGGSLCQGLDYPKVSTILQAIDN